MTDTELDDRAAALGITLQPAWRDGVRTNLDVSVRLATLAAAFPLEDDAAPAPVFRA